VKWSVERDIHNIRRRFVFVTVSVLTDLIWAWYVEVVGWNGKELHPTPTSGIVRFRPTVVGTVAEQEK